MIYWLLFLAIIFIHFKYKKNGIFYLWIGFYLFCISSFISIVNLISIAEFFMRISFVFLIVGFILMAYDFDGGGTINPK